jgi:predicted ATPase/DNA-binding SARP family transcriptional activator
VHVSILGPLLVEHDGAPREIAGGRLQALLARLAIDAGRPVSHGALADAVWEGDPPRDVQHALQSLVSRLRRALGDPGLIVQEAAGYRLALTPDAVDAPRFERLAREGAAALRAGDPAGAGRLLAEALGLWRGEPVADALRLQDVRLAARIDLLAAAAERGAVAEHVAELTELADEHPLDERLGALRMRALAESGRQAEAFAAYETLRSALDDELGAMPSAVLQEAHLAVLRGEVAVAPTARGNLPAARTSFVGREADLQRAADLLSRHRLVTLVGTGGAGKTRLALELAARAPGTSWLVELASLGDGESLAPAVLGALGIREATLPDRRTTAADAESRLLDALGASDALLVLDNCEHIVVAAAELADRLLAGCPRLRILATSREPLGIGGEALAPVGPLEEESAVLLFAQRAASATPDFALDETTAPVVADVCRRIDGLPLAIELAAARLRSMSLQDLSDRLHDRFRLLTGGSRAAAGRQRTLRAVVDWSWDLLSEPERRLARRLSVFPAGATLDAVEAVCAGDGVDADEVFDLLCALVDRSLLGVRGAGTSRWRMLETIREYAEEEAERAGELPSLRAAHAAHYTALVQQADEHLRGPDQLPWLARLRDDRDNVLSAVRFLGETGGGATALRTVTTLLWFWALDGNREDALVWLRFALSAGGDADPLDRLLAEAIVAWSDPDARPVDPRETVRQAAELLDGVDVTGRPLLAVIAPIITLMAGDQERGDAMLTALDESQDPWLRAMAPFARGQIAENLGELGEMATHIDLAIERFRAAGDRWGLAASLSELASLHMFEGDLDAAESALAESERLLGELGSGSPSGMTIMRRADLLTRRGDHVAARDLLQEALLDAGAQEERQMLMVFLAGTTCRLGDVETARALRDEAMRAVDDASPARPDFGHQRAIVYGFAGRLSVEDGELDAAREQLGRAYEAAVASDDLPIAGRVGEATALLALRSGAPEVAAEMLGAGMRLRGTDDPHNPETVAVVDELRAALGGDAADDAIAAGRALDRAAALARLDPATLDAVAVGPQRERDEDREQAGHPRERPREV